MNQQQAGHTHLQLTSKMIDCAHITSSRDICIWCSSRAGIYRRSQRSTSKALKHDDHDCLCTVQCRKVWHLRLIGLHSCSSKAGNCRSHWLQLTLRMTKSSGNSDTLLLLLRKRCAFFPAAASSASCLTIPDPMHTFKASISVKLSKAKLEIQNKLNLGRGFLTPNTNSGLLVSQTGGCTHISQHICR